MITTPVTQKKSFDTSSSSHQGAVGPKETRLRLLLQAEVKLLSDMKAAGDDSAEIEEDLKGFELFYVTNESFCLEPKSTSMWRKKLEVTES